MNPQSKKPNPQLIWHPYTPAKDELISISKGKGAYLYSDDGTRYIDAGSSWWTNIHGHSHPYIAEKIFEQAKKLEHVIFAGFTHHPAEKLAVKILAKIPFHQKVFYSDNGSTAVEVAVKMSLQYWWNKGETRKKVIAFKDAYHGDTFGAMSVSARGVFTEPYQHLLFDVEFIDTPTPGNEQKTIGQLNSLLKMHSAEIAAFIFEPLILGSAGMLMYDEKTLDELISICKANNIITIADEVMTGFGRTGKFLAVDYCDNKPDIICLSKGITGGFLPFAATTCTKEIFDAFDSSDRAKMLFHGHSYTANPIGCAAAIASFEVFETDNSLEKIARINARHLAFVEKIKLHASIKDIRCRGSVLAIEIKTSEQSGYLNKIRDVAYQYFLHRKIIMRPLGNVVYVLPPYCISAHDLEEIYNAISGLLDLVLTIDNSVSS
ncbi:MAG: adenosylmethionine--8-amino-7-oxononanoate transaminase [Bacteroidota bacterium]|nr:adenosylmethionine--8-amino-7-oxononanoate transaminase [Bacteroidota bacterium]